MLADRIRGALADLFAMHVDAAHARLRGKMDELGVERMDVAFAQVEALLGQDDDAAAFGGFVGERCQLRGVG